MFLVPLYTLGATPVTPAELSILEAAAQSGDWSVSDYTHPTRRRIARNLGFKGLLRFIDAKEGGWEPGTWSGTLTCPGWNSLWRAKDDRHFPSCDGQWQADGSCSGCHLHRFLDLDAFELLIEKTSQKEREFLTSKSRLWCDEHGFAGESDWTTDKTCRKEGSAHHERSFMRV